MTKTEIMQTSDMYVIKAKSKTTTAVTAKRFHVFDTSGWAQAGAGARGPHGVPVESVAAPASGQSDIEILLEGTCKVEKAAGALNQGTYVKSDANGKAVAWVGGVDELEIAAGVVVEDAANDDTEVMIKLIK